MYIFRNVCLKDVTRIVSVNTDDLYEEKRRGSGGCVFQISVYAGGCSLLSGDLHVHQTCVSKPQVSSCRLTFVVEVIYVLWAGSGHHPSRNSLRPTYDAIPLRRAVTLYNTKTNDI